MNNIVIYSSKPMPELEALLFDVDDADVRTVDINQMKDYAVINPSLIIVENIDAAQDALMTNKFPCPILFIGKARRDFTVRAEGFDFIENPSNKDELIIRANALLRIKAIKDFDKCNKELCNLEPQYFTFQNDNGIIFYAGFL